MSNSSSRLWRYSLYGIGGLIALIVLVLTLISLALYTEAGSRRITLAVLARANAVDGINLQSEHISGNLLSGLTLSGAVIEIPGANIKATSIRAAWNPWSVLSGRFYLSGLDLNDLAITLLDDPSDPNTVATDPVSMLRMQALPINVAVGALTVSNLTLVQNGETLTIQQLSLAAQLNGQELQIEDMRLQSNNLIVDLDRKSVV